MNHYRLVSDSSAWYDSNDRAAQPWKMKNPRTLACLLLLPVVLGLTLQEDDLVFDDVGEDSTSTAATVVNRHLDEQKISYREQKRPYDSKRHQVERLRGVPDVVVPVGHALKLRIPRQAFTGSVDYYEVRSNESSFPPQVLDAGQLSCTDPPHPTLVADLFPRLIFCPPRSFSPCLDLRSLELLLLGIQIFVNELRWELFCSRIPKTWVGSDCWSR